MLLNGPPAAGKSTIAARVALDHPLMLNLDIDVVRGMLGDWIARPTEAGLLARRMAIAMARVALTAGHDVVVPQFLARPDFIGELEALARETGCAFTEIVLTADRDDVIAWFQARAEEPATASHTDATRLLDATGGIEELHRLLDRWEELMATRPGVHRVPARTSDIDGTYAQVVRVLAQGI